MTPKKNQTADLERFRLIFLEAGLLLALGIVLLAFEWNSVPLKSTSGFFTKPISDVEEVIIQTRPEDQKPQEKPRPKLITMLTVVDDDIQTFDFPELYVEDTRENEGIWDNGFQNEPEDLGETYPPYVVQDKPLFNGGDPFIEFRKFINKEIIYPQEAIDNGIKGRVVLQFIIDERGNLTDLTILGSVHPVLDQEALRVVKLSPKWTPGRQGIRNVKVIYQFPVVFSLQ